MTAFDSRRFHTLRAERGEMKSRHALRDGGPILSERSGERLGLVARVRRWPRSLGTPTPSTTTDSVETATGLGPGQGAYGGRLGEPANGDQSVARGGPRPNRGSGGQVPHPSGDADPARRTVRNRRRLTRRKAGKDHPIVVRTRSVAAGIGGCRLQSETVIALTTRQRSDARGPSTRP